MARLRNRLIALAAASAVAFPKVAGAQAGMTDSVTVVPGAAYARGGVYRFFFGDHYRDLWTTPVRVPLLDLATFAGGLRPLKRGGGTQTKSLRFQGADGRQYAFRSVDKDPTAALPPDLRETFADRLFQDQISSGHPVGGLVVPPILAAAGVLHATPTLVVLPDHPALGEYRAEFGNLLGMIEERPRDADDDDVSFAGALEIVGSEDFLDAIEERADVRVDSRAFLRARLTDIFLGDWDRHRDQWRWALVEQGGRRRWVPIPRDRDQAFVRFDGFLLRLVRRQVPQLVEFGPDYPEIVGATWNGRDLDRRLLTDLEWPAWDSVATDLERRLTDPVIEAAVSRLPRELRAIDGPRLSAALKARRDGLGAMARRYYGLLAREVDIHATDEADRVRVERVDERSVLVEIGGDRPWYRRQFDRSETADIRVYLHGGDDRAVLGGEGSVPTSVRFIGGGGDDVMVDSSRMGKGKFYDDRGANEGVGHDINAKPYEAIDHPEDPTALPHRDWGRKAISFPFASVSPDAGITLGWGGRFTRYAFRKKPFASRLVYTAVAATGAKTGRLVVSYRAMRENARSFFEVDALASGIEVLRWHGFGNERSIDPDQPPAFYRATQHSVELAPVLGWALGERSVLTVGPRLRYSVTETDDGQNATRFIGLDPPFGTSGFAQLGLAANLEVDTRDVPLAARRGVHLKLGARYQPALLDVTDAYGSVGGEVAAYLSASIPTQPTLALLGGATRIWGTAGSIPFHDAAFLGSGRTLRGFRSNRFAGDRGAVWGSAELRLALTKAFIFVPGRQGVFGFYDVGRVYHSEETSDLWHDSVGGGIWMSFLTRGSMLSFSAGNSDEGTRFHAAVGFAF
ncbi:MAG: BamA/TamA family outer membrane protein [Gemmatimonadales bacterium]